MSNSGNSKIVNKNRCFAKKINHSVIVFLVQCTFCVTVLVVQMNKQSVAQIPNEQPAFEFESLPSLQAYPDLPEFSDPNQGFVDPPTGFEPAISRPGDGFAASPSNFREISSDYVAEYPSQYTQTPYGEGYAVSQTQLVPPPPPVNPRPQYAQNAHPNQENLAQVPDPIQHQQSQSVGFENYPVAPVPNDRPKDQSQMVIDVRVVGNGQIPLEKLRLKVKSRPNRPFNEQQVEEDKRALVQTGWFLTVNPNIYRGRDGIIITYELVERRLLHYVKFVGNTIYPRKKLQEEAGISPGDALDSMAVMQAKARLEDFYKAGGHHKIHIEVLSGDRATDRGAIFLINEGNKQRIDRVKFVGCNSQISGARLKTLIESKPGWFYFIGGEFTREKLDADVEKLTEYYRNLGYFFAKIDRDYEEGRGYTGFGQEDCWVTVRFVIDEGPRCKINSLNIIGNRVHSGAEIVAAMKKTHVGKYYNYFALENDINKIKDLYGKDGRVFTEVEKDYVVDVIDTPKGQEGIFDLTISIKESRQCKFGEVTVDILDQTGGKDSYTKTAVVMNRAPKIRPGAMIETAEIRNTQRRLKSSMLFNSNPQNYLPEVIFELDDSQRPYMFEQSAVAEELGTTRGQSPQAKKGSVSDYVVSPMQPRGGNSEDDMIKDGLRKTELMFAESERKEQTTFPQRNQPLTLPADNSHGEREQIVPATNGGKRPYFADPNVGKVPQKPVVLGQSGRSIPTQPAATTVNQYGSTPSNNTATTTYPPNPEPGAFSSQYYGSVPRGNSASISSNYPNDSNGQQPTVQPYNPNESTDNPGGTVSPYDPYTNDLYPASATDNYYGYGDSTPAGQRGRLLSGPTEFVPGPNNPYTQGGGLMDPVMPGSVGNQDYNNSIFRPKPEPILTVPTKIRVQETTTGQFMASVGVNSDAGVTARFVYREDHFDWRRPPKNFFRFEDWRNAFRGGGQRFKIEAQPGTDYQRYEVAWEEPNLFNTDWSLGTSGFYYTRNYTEWREQRAGGSVSLGYRLTPDLLFNTYYKGESVEVFRPIMAGIPDLDRVLGTNSLHTFGIKLVHDTRDNIYLATEGHLISFDAKQVVGSFQYPRLEVDARQYFMLRERPDTSGRWVLGFRSAAGWSDIDTPIFERYYAGGFTTLRGFDFRGVSPRHDWIPIGGNFEFYNSAELLFPITADDMIRGVVFVDTGCVQSKINEWDQKYRVAPGFGLRISIPFMGPAPIAFDFAFPISKDPTDKTNVFSFYVGFMR